MFGIQSRAGCSCAGPYGHRLLTINHTKSEQYRKVINEGYQGIKPGWTRVNFHYTIPEYEFNFILNAIEFISKFGHVFLSEYQFNVLNGEWNHKRTLNSNINRKSSFDMQSISKTQFSKEKTLNESQREEIYSKYLAEAKTLANTLQNKYLDKFGSFKDKNMEELRFFNFIEN